VRKKHAKKEVEEALQYAEEHGWRVDVGGSHAWGKFIAHKMIKAVVVESSAYQVYGVHRKMQ